MPLKKHTVRLGSRPRALGLSGLPINPAGQQRHPTTRLEAIAFPAASVAARADQGMRT